MAARPWIRLSPRVVTHEVGATRPPLARDALALPQLPSRAFGDGSHPTTRLCAIAVDHLCRLERPTSVLDVGTGTGVLARLARARGARFVVATDIDAHALAAARANAALDPDAAELHVEDLPPDHWGPRFDLVVANILEDPLRGLAGPIARALAPGGALLLSGFTPIQTPALANVYAGAGLRRELESTLEGWALLLLRRPRGE